jgi:hypothetical protein
MHIAEISACLDNIRDILNAAALYAVVAQLSACM